MATTHTKTYRVKVEERTTRVVEKWFKAGSAEEARTLAEAQMGGGGTATWQEVYSDADVAVTLVEDVDSGEVVWDRVSGDPT